MAEIAIALRRALRERDVNGAAGALAPRMVARGDGWSVADVMCTSGPRDRPFEEQHTDVAIAIVLAGSFEYRSTHGRDLMTPGSLLLGSAGQSFECGHRHGEGDRCLSFCYAPPYFERLAFDAAGGEGVRLRRLRIPPLRELSPVVADAFAALGGSGTSWEEIGVRLAAKAAQLATGASPDRPEDPPGSVARVTQAIRLIERHPEAPLSLSVLAREARLSPYHFLRTFERIAGVTPHQYIVRTRLRGAAARLLSESAKVVDVVLESGFGDVSNFNRAFRAEFGVSPRAFRQRARVGSRQPIVVS